MTEVVRAARRDNLEIEDVAELAQRLAVSGETLVWPECVTADVSSTGGPSSLSTLLTSYYLVHMGLSVPKLGVPGRPAGGIDVMATIPGFQTALTTAEVRRCVEACGHAHFLAGGRFAPLDAALFSFRQQAGGQTVGDLVIASILSKKLAVGVQRACVDVRVAEYNNLGGDYESGARHAARMISVAQRLGIRLRVFLTDASYPYQPAIGRGEALQALWSSLIGEAEGHLRRHAIECWAMARSLSDTPERVLPSSTLANRLQAHLEAQGTDMGALERRLAEIDAEPSFIVEAEGDGWLRVDLDAIRSLLIEANAAPGREDSSGLWLLATHGETVESGQPLARVRAQAPSQSTLRLRLAAALRVVSWPSLAPRLPITESLA